MLRVEDVVVRFGGLSAVDGVSLEVPVGSVTGLIGPNGAGKTTVFNVISGLQRPDAGRVWFGDREITGLSTAKRARLGIARTFQRLEVFGTMTAEENILVAAELHRSWSDAKTDPRAVTKRLLDRLHLTAVAEVQADTLPTGLARLLELGRALASDPTLLLLDEPSSGLNTTETDAFAELLVELTETGLGVLLVEHDMDLVMRVSKHVWVLESGRIIANGDPATVQADPAVRLAYLGEEAHVHDEAPSGNGVTPAAAGALSAAAPPAPSATAPLAAGAAARPSAGPATAATAVTAAAPADGRATTGAPALELVGIRAGYGEIEVLHGVDLTVPAGSVFALLGPNGAGKTTTLKAASGRLSIRKGGAVRLEGVEITKRSAERRSRAGLCTIPEGRGVFPNLSVSENLQMWTFRGGLRRRDVEERAYAQFPILSQRRHQLAGTLSGGEQQMLAMSRALSTNPRVLLLDEISMGLAPLIVAELYEVVAGLAATGLSILVVEQSVRTALSVADHAAVMANGRIVLAGTPDEVASSVFDVYLGAAK
jgi:branched-chain amino acid transport system ATP-binding protein